MSLFGTGRREGFLAVLLLLALAMLQHAPGLFFGTPRQSATPSIAERGEAATNGAVLLPAMQQVGATVRSGNPTRWNEHARLGEPFAASGAPTAWPLYWPLAVWPKPAVLELLMFLHAALACVTAYRLLRVLSVSRYGAFIGSGLYGLGWFMTIALDRLPEAAAAAVLPACLELTWRCLFAKRRTSVGVGLGLTLWAMFATGGTSTATLGAGLVCTTFAFGLTSIDREDRRAALLALATGAGLAILMLAPLWLDYLQLRDALRPEIEPTPRRLQPIGTLGALAPGLFGEDSATAPNAIRSLNPGADALELALYPGAIVLFLSLLGLMRPKRTLQPLYWLVVAGIALLLALDGPLSDLLVATVGWAPRRPGASLAILHLAVAVLASLGIENFFDAPRSRRLALPITAAACLLFSALATVALLPETRLLSAVVEWLAHPADATETANGVAHLRRHLLVPAIATALLALAFLFWHRLGILRFKAVLATVALGELCVLALVAVPRATFDDRAERIAATIPEGDGRTVRFGSRIPVQSSRLAGRNGLQVLDSDGRAILDRTAHLLELVQPGLVRGRPDARVTPLSKAASVDDPLLARAGVSVILSDAPLLSVRYTPLLAAPGGAASHGPIVNLALEVTPRARLAFRATPAESQSAAARALLTRQDEPLDSVVIESPPASFEPRRPATPPSLDWVVDRPDLCRLDVDLGDGRGYLVIRDAWAPGWYATVDAEPTRILAADLAFRAIPLREGRHVVELRYDPLGSWLGLPLAAAGLVLALAGLVLPRLLRRR